MTTGLWLVTWTSARGVERRDVLETEKCAEDNVRLWTARVLRARDVLDAWGDDEGDAVDACAARLAGGAAFRVERLVPESAVAAVTAERDEARKCGA